MRFTSKSDIQEKLWNSLFNLHKKLFDIAYICQRYAEYDSSDSLPTWKGISMARYGEKIKRGKKSGDLYLIWECSTEKHCLSCTTWRHAHLLNNLPDLGLKAHVQHPVSLI